MKFMACRAGGASFTLNGMRYRALGNTGFQVSEVAFGGWAIGGNAFGDSYGATDDAESLAALNRAYELGCNYFDTADVYGHGHSEMLIGQALKGWQRDKVFIATAGGQDFTEAAQAKAGGVKSNFSAAYLRQAVEGSLRRLGVEAIDLYQLHTPPLELVQHAQVFEVLKELKQQGKIRFYGIVIHDPQEGVQAIHLGQVDAVHAIYNLFDTRVEKSLLPLCAETKTALIIREPLARGFLSGAMVPERTFEPGDNRAVWPKPLVNKRIQAAERFRPLLPEGYAALSQLAIAFPLSQATVSTVLVGCKTRAQVEENFATAQLPPLDETTLTAIREVQAALY
jgi:aryl-alcohol dehydrogenase-like predicted oxidoreductase